MHGVRRADRSIFKCFFSAYKGSTNATFPAFSIFPLTFQKNKTDVVCVCRKPSPAGTRYNNVSNPDCSRSARTLPRASVPTNIRETVLTAARAIRRICENSALKAKPTEKKLPNDRRMHLFLPLRRFLTKSHGDFSQLICGSWWILSLRYSMSRKPYA